MFVEDDFALCGQWGWENFMKVMARLNEGRKLNGAFIGTGGSGLVFHRSLLPALEHMLSVITALDSEHATHSPMPADVLLQQCLSGELLFCPNDGYVISSRMLMGHRGGKLSTGNRIYDDGKWACGWRHPQHGNKGAEVVVS
ncbi:hypothetical protein BDW22DRAFT_1338850 [Trametopsis cervina]|nr:hypothetical protein BDW22DRAFT_1338850 [Trametopsis cervina]